MARPSAWRWRLACAFLPSIVAYSDRAVRRAPAGSDERCLVAHEQHGRRDGARLPFFTADSRRLHEARDARGRHLRWPPWRPVHRLALARGKDVHVERAHLLIVGREGLPRTGCSKRPWGLSMRASA